MEILAFIATVVLVSLSGVLMPGPVFATTISEGRKNKKVGFMIATGHAIIEIPIIIALFAFGSVKLSEPIKAFIGIIGGIVLLFFAFTALKDKPNKTLNGIIAGIALSSLNPYFIMWWLTVGLTLAINATAFNIVGLIVLIVFHTSCDYIWYGAIGYLAFIGTRFKKAQNILLALSFVLLLFFGFYFIFDSIQKII